MRLLPAFVTLSVALWLGSLAHTLLSVASLFRFFPKAASDVAVEAAPVLFFVTERANLAIGGVAIIGAALWRLFAPARARTWLAVLLAVAGVLSLVQISVISARMDALRAAGQSGAPTFRSLHGLSSTQYLAQTALLLAATLTLPAAIRSASARDTTPAAPMA